MAQRTRRGPPQASGVQEGATGPAGQAAGGPAEASGDAAETAATLYRLWTAMVHYVDLDISLTAASTLGTLQRGARRVTELATVMDLAQPSMTALVNRLERSGLVERHRNAEDQRVVLVSLTQAGAEYLEAFRAAGAQALTSMVAALPPWEAAALAAASHALEHLREFLEDERRRRHH